MNHFKYSESAVAQQIGVPREDLKAVRKDQLSEGTDWKREQGEIALSNSGLTRIWRALKIRPGTIDLSLCLVSQKNGGAIRMDDISSAERSKRARKPMLVRVTRIYPNPFLLQAAGDRPGDGPYEVRVQSNLVWTVSEKILILPDETQHGFYKIAGPRPNYKGDRTYQLRLAAVLDK